MINCGLKTCDRCLKSEVEDILDEKSNELIPMEQTPEGIFCQECIEEMKKEENSVSLYELDMHMEKTVKAIFELSKSVFLTDMEIQQELIKEGVDVNSFLEGVRRTVVKCKKYLEEREKQRNGKAN